MSFLSWAASPASPLAAPADDGPGNPWFSRYVAGQRRILLTTSRPCLADRSRRADRHGRRAALAVVSYWWRPLTGPILALCGILYTIQSLALLALVAPRVGTTTDLSVLIRPGAVRAAGAGAQLAGRADPGARRGAGRGGGHGTGSSAAVADRAAAGPARHPDRLRLATVSTVALVTVGGIIGKGGLGASSWVASGTTSTRRRSSPRPSLRCVALVLDLILAGIGRALTPWSRRRQAT